MSAAPGAPPVPKNQEQISSSNKDSDDLINDTFTLVLDRVDEPGPGPTTLECKFTYTWDPEKDEGYAQLDSVDGSVQNPPLPITLNPAGIKGELAFFGSAKGESNAIKLPDGLTTIIYSAWLVIKDDQNMASFKLGLDGKLILSTENWPEDSKWKEAA
ncbi:hypothetical protein AOQ84DRAFT_364530 [Glonium stellatum]|uniref:Uncharacterized protein n=1 Tax=Glonium stellatum TaxID=574774 RepID=A0A8E2F032_9PEZI|nr:hypothetical protein AOQ84DRAFT_364530 [Glonium stellatum]